MDQHSISRSDRRRCRRRLSIEGFADDVFTVIGIDLLLSNVARRFPLVFRYGGSTKNVDSARYPSLRS